MHRLFIPVALGLLFVGYVVGRAEMQPLEPRKDPMNGPVQNFRTVTGTDRTVEQARLTAELHQLRQASAGYYLDPSRWDPKRCEENASSSSATIHALRDRVFRLNPPDEELEFELGQVMSCMSCDALPGNSGRSCDEVATRLANFRVGN